MDEAAAERREQILGDLAEWMHEAAREAHLRLMAAEDADEFATFSSSLTRLARSTRQCLLMQRRFEAERLAGVSERRADETAARKARLARRVAQRLDEAFPDREDLSENETFNERLETLDTRLDDLAEAEDFLDLDPDALIARLCQEFGIDPPPAPACPTAAAAAGGGPSAPGVRPEAGPSTGSEPMMEGASPAHGAGRTLHAPNTS